MRLPESPKEISAYKILKNNDNCKKIDCLKCPLEDHAEIFEPLKEATRARWIDIDTGTKESMIEYNKVMMQAVRIWLNKKEVYTPENLPEEFIDDMKGRDLI